MNRLRGALLFSAVAQQSNLLISFVSIAVIARLLTPSEIGVFAVAGSLAVLAIELRSFGVGQYLVREQELTEEKKRTALGIMLLISWTMAAVIVVSAPLAASFYDQPDLKHLFWILSGTFLIAPFSTVPFSMLLRDMQFDKVLQVKFVSGVVRAGGSIGFVLLGWSYYGLAAGVLLGAVAELCVISWIDRSRSLLTPSLKLWREISGFGMTTSTIGVLQRFTQSVPDLVLGRTASMADVGMFSRGLGTVLFLNRLISMAVNPVILPHLSSIRRRNGDVGQEYLKCIVMHGAVSLPAFAVIAVLSLPLIRLFFGDQWDAAAPIASVLAAWAMLQTVHGFLPNALIALGLERTVLWKEALVFVVRLALIIAATDHGLLAVAWMIVVSGAFELVLSAALAARHLSIAPTRVARAFLPDVVLAGVCWSVSSLTLSVVSTSASASGAFVQTSVAGVATVLTWLATLRLLKHGLWSVGTEMVSDAFLGAKRAAKLGDTPP